MPTALYTIGYATKPIDIFINHLNQYNVDVVADVRSVPYSKIFHDYHREALADRLQQHSIAYTFLGEELGPRSKNPKHYDCGGQVQFDRLMQSKLFEKGIQRLQKGLDRKFTIALMCAEKDPATCHRSLLLGYFLVRNGFDSILHIDHDGKIEGQKELEHRLYDIHGMSDDLFTSLDEQIDRAYQLQLKDTSYCKPSED